MDIEIRWGGGVLATNMQELYSRWNRDGNGKKKEVRVAERTRYHGVDITNMDESKGECIGLTEF